MTEEGNTEGRKIPLGLAIKVLPNDAIALLQDAARTPNTRGDAFARRRAIKLATDIVRFKYPKFFRKLGDGNVQST
jgi:hypothetical protein